MSKVRRINAKNHCTFSGLRQESCETEKAAQITIFFCHYSFYSKIFRFHLEIFQLIPSVWYRKQMSKNEIWYGENCINTQISHHSCKLWVSISSLSCLIVFLVVFNRNFNLFLKNVSTHIWQHGWCHWRMFSYQHKEYVYM